MSRHKCEWSELYSELLISITSRFNTRQDFLHVRAVCKKWRLSIPTFPQDLPILSPHFPHKFTQTPLPLIRYNCSTAPVANTTFLLQPIQNSNPNTVPPKPWLITLEEFNPGKLFIRMPLVRTPITQYLPENFPRVLDLSKYSIREICKAYNFRFATDYYPINSKLIMFFYPYCASPSVDDGYALLLHDNGSLLYVRLKDDYHYGYLSYSRVSCFDDLVNYKGAVWGIDRKGRVYVIPYGKNRLRLMLFADDAVCTGYAGDTRKRLVESSEGLYMIDRYHYDELIKFRVYKLNEREHKWSGIKSLDGRILFVSSDCCFFASGEDFPGS